MVEMKYSSSSSTTTTTSSTSDPASSSLFRESTNAFRSSSLSSSQLVLLDGEAMFHRRERQSPLTNPQFISERLSEALGQAFQERQNPMEWARAVRLILHSHSDKRPLCDVLLRGVALTSFFEEYLYYAMSTNLIPPLLCIECIPAYATPTNSLIGPLAAEPQSINTHLKIIADILSAADMNLFELLKSSPLNPSDYDAPKSIEARGLKRKATEALDKMVVDENGSNLNGDSKSQLANSRTSKTLRSSSLSLSSSGLWPIGNVDQNGESLEDSSDSDDGVDPNGMIEQIPGDFAATNKKDDISSSILTAESKRLSLIILELCKLLVSIIELSLHALVQGRLQSAIQKPNLAEKERCLQATNLVESLRIFTQLLSNDKNTALLSIAKVEYSETWDGLYARLEALHGAGDWFYLVSKEGDDFGYSASIPGSPSLSTVLHQLFSKFWNSLYDFFMLQQVKHSSNHNAIQHVSIYDRPLGIVFPNGIADNDHRPPMALAFMIEDEIIGVGFKSIRCFARRLEGVKATMGNIPDATFLSELWAAAIRAIFRRKKGARDWVKATNLLLFKIPCVLRMWQDEVQERGINKTFLDAIPRTLTYKQEPIAIGNLRTPGASQDDGASTHIPHSANFLTMASPQEGSYQTPTPSMTTPSPFPGGIVNPPSDDSSTYNPIEQSIIHLFNFPALIQSLSSIDSTQDRESYVFDITYACAKRYLLSWEKIQHVIPSLGSFQSYPTTLTITIPPVEGSKPSSPLDVRHLEEAALTSDNPDTILSVMKCLVNGLNTQWQIRENIINSVINMLEQSSQIPPITVALLLQACSEMHVNLELFGDHLPTFIKLTIMICDRFGTVMIQGPERAFNHTKLFPPAFLILSHFMELCEMRAPSNIRTRNVMRDILNSVPDIPGTYTFSNWFRDYVEFIVDSGGVDHTNGCGNGILSVLFKPGEESKSLLEEQLDKFTPWQVIQACPNLISRVYADLLNQRYSSRSLQEGLKLLMSLAKYCIVPLVSFLWNDVITRSWDTQTGKPFAWGIMKTLIPDLPTYVKDAIQIQRTKIVALWTTPNEPQKPFPVVYREVYRPPQPMHSYVIHDCFHSIIDRVVLSTLSLQEFKSILEKTGKRNFCNFIIKEVIKTTDDNSEMVGPFAANSIRAAELGACILSSAGGVSTISYMLLETLPQWVNHLSSCFTAHVFAHFAIMILVYGVFPLLGDQSIVERAETDLLLTQFFLWLTDNLENAVNGTLAPSSAFFMTVTSVLIDFKQLTQYAPKRRIARALCSLGNSNVIYPLFDLTDTKERLSLYRFLRQTS